MKIFLWLLGLLCVIAGAVGSILCGLNVLQKIFEVGGSYPVALTGFIMALACTFVGKLLVEFGNSMDK